MNTHNNPLPPNSPPLPRSYFETEDWKGVPGQWWFGGGTDITPCYVNEDDMRHFHGTYKVGVEGSTLQFMAVQVAQGAVQVVEGTDGTGGGDPDLHPCLLPSSVHSPPCRI